MKNLTPPILTNDSQCIRKSRDRFGIPGRLSNREFAFEFQLVRQESNDRKQSQQSRGCSEDGPIRPLALGLNTQVSSNLLEGHFQLPAQDEPLQDLLWLDVQVGTKQGLGFELPFGSRIKTQRIGKAGIPL